MLINVLTVFTVTSVCNHFVVLLFLGSLPVPVLATTVPGDFPLSAAE